MTPPTIFLFIPLLVMDRITTIITGILNVCPKPQSGRALSFQPALKFPLLSRKQPPRIWFLLKTALKKYEFLFFFLGGIAGLLEGFGRIFERKFFVFQKIFFLVVRAG